MRAKKTRVTARPKPISDDVATHEPTEEGLSIEPEEMGQSFLRYATGQTNFEALRGASAEELSASGASSGDESLDGVYFSPDASVWSNTVALASQAENLDDLTRDADPPLLDAEDSEESDELETRRGVAEIDLTESVIDEASLLDDESDVLGEVIPKQSRTEDGGHHKSRGR